MERIGVRELECFVAVAEELNFARAARRLHLTQPPLSRQIRKLEEKLGAELFLRDSHSVALTPVGQMLLSEARALLRQHDRVRDMVHVAKSGRLEILHIGFVASLLDEEMVGLLKKFSDRRPSCQIRVHELGAAEISGALLRKEVDAVFSGTPPNSLEDGLQKICWEIPGYHVLLASEHPLAKRKQIVLEDLADENWVMISREIAPHFHARVQMACARAGFRPRIVHESDRLSGILAMVALGEGIGLVPHSNLRFHSPHVLLKPLKGALENAEHALVIRDYDNPEALAEFVAGLKADKSL